MTLRTMPWFLACALLLALGCGGGGGAGGGSGSGGSTGSGAAPAPGQYIEFLDTNGNWLDPLNLPLSQTGSAVIASYDSLGGRTPLVASAWATTAPGNVPINGLGTFAVNSSPGAEFLFRGTASIFGVPTVFEQAAAVPTGTATIAGRVVELGLFTGTPTGTGVPHVRVDFFNVSGIKVASARTLQDGRFRAVAPTTVQYMMIYGDSVSTKYNRSVYYQGLFYSPADTGCRIVIGPISAGTNNIASSMALHLAAAGPPPPPSACS